MASVSWRVFLRMLFLISVSFWSWLMGRPFVRGALRGIDPGNSSFSQFARGGLGWIDPGKAYFSQFARGAGGMVDPGKFTFLSFTRGGLGWIDPGKSYFSQFARGAGGIFDPGIFTFLAFARVDLGSIDPGKASFSQFARGAGGMVDPDIFTFLSFARGAGGMVDPGIFTFSPFARVNSEKSSVSLARTLSIAAPPTAFSAALLPQLRRQLHFLRRSVHNCAANRILSGAPLFPQLGAAQMTAASAFDKSLPECSISNAPGKSSFLSFVRVAWGGLPPAYSLFSRLPGRGRHDRPLQLSFLSVFQGHGRYIQS